MSHSLKVCLGYGVYADFRHDEVLLTTKDGGKIRDRIYLPKEELESLVSFAQRVGMLK